MMSYLDNLKYERKRISLEYQRKIWEATKPTDAIALIEVRNRELELRDEEIEFEMSSRILLEAKELDVDIPDPNDGKLWIPSRYEIPYLTSTGRAGLRKLIDEEKARRFEVKTRWVTKFILPLVAALIGIIGALTGLVAILQHKK
jgi:hypothetical protein